MSGWLLNYDYRKRLSEGRSTHLLFWCLNLGMDIILTSLSFKDYVILTTVMMVPLVQSVPCSNIYQDSCLNSDCDHDAVNRKENHLKHISIIVTINHHFKHPVVWESTFLTLKTKKPALYRPQEISHSLKRLSG